MERALELHREAAAGAEGWMLGRFVCPASRLEELSAALHPGERVELSVVLDDGRPLRQPEDERLLAQAFEVRVPPEEDVTSFVERFARESHSGTGFFETADRVDEVVGAVAADNERHRRLLMHWSAMKLRCGGATAEAFPPPERVAHFLAACAASGVWYKATAGLHHPVRHVNPATGFTEHGFLNLLAASVFLANGLVTNDQLIEVLEERDPEAFVLDRDLFGWRDLLVDHGDVERGRHFVVGFGSCSFAEPVEDLRALGVLPL